MAAVDKNRKASTASRGRPASQQKQLTDEQVKDIKRAFDMFDIDGSGAIDRSELTSALYALGIPVTDSDVQGVMVVADKNKKDEEGSDEVDYKEFVRLMQDKVLGADPKDNVLRAFTAFDTNCDNKISLQELKSMFWEMGDDATEEELQEIIDVCGTGDGAISQEEFLRIMKKNGLY
mmetsp:Transcript_10112/g.22747  ORF Transcript_10112/g.22747 Transcript_10112/m.22747 type:complete len:177 (-) Transcript_10112:121-651(-)|eukprot:CAMPEP_0178460496 /NCGR_PEP_ID=MMETSP0689_2-20121128/48744_1 /TAXON_ID=160604 /ORGANISM="Amphidinium massartii, Strain CS-259" /LENGTH=176 /DNA_ID=CAMNT_0020087143 /DNA_START=64 /DNA_END=594 /DNA_ORIENTATION=+